VTSKNQRVTESLW